MRTWIHQQSLHHSFPTYKVGTTIEQLQELKELKHLVNARHRTQHSRVLRTWALARAPLMTRFLNLSVPLFSHQERGDPFNKAVVRTN